jgi:hypothetical protein
MFVCVMVFNVTFSNISVISWWSVLLVEETEDQEKTTDLLQDSDKFDHIMLYTSPWSRFEFTTSVVIGNDCVGSCESNYHTITATTAPNQIWEFKYFEISKILISKYLNQIDIQLNIYITMLLNAKKNTISISGSSDDGWLIDWFVSIAAYFNHWIQGLGNLKDHGA